ncbi:MAG: AtpZ/AtpI family protein [Bacteroidota bacterium]|jgi:F0F1-type ATP synthase assembly protein I
MTKRSSIENKSKESTSASSREFMKYTSMAFQMIGSILVFVFMGYFIDNSWAKQQLGFPVFTIVGTLLGVAASLYLILKKI